MYFRNPQKIKKLGSTLCLVLPVCLPILVSLFLAGCGLLLLEIAKPFSDRSGFFLMFVQYLGNIPSGFCHDEGTVYHKRSGFWKRWNDPYPDVNSAVHRSVPLHQILLPVFPVPGIAAGQIAVRQNICFPARPAFSAQLPWRQYLSLELPFLHRRRNPESEEALLFRNAVRQYLLTKYRR